MRGYDLFLPQAMVDSHSLEEIVIVAANTTIVRPLRVYRQTLNVDEPSKLIATIEDMGSIFVSAA